jgi:hypothetical protein
MKPAPPVTTMLTTGKATDRYRPGLPPSGHTSVTFRAPVMSTHAGSGGHAFGPLQWVTAWLRAGTAGAERSSRSMG